MNKPRKDASSLDSQVIQLKPVGIVRSQSKGTHWGSASSKIGWRERSDGIKGQQESVSEIIIDKNLEGILDGIEEFSHILVLYWAHLVPAARRSTKKVHPMGNKDFPLVGVFATRSPVRPNSILTSVVRLVERKGNILKVSGLDALDGSPVLDIKSYHPERELKDVKVPDWMQ
jgi:tRNA-Thr(GGU) m(6)t(6)A37 methyltransferase TsaA